MFLMVSGCISKDDTTYTISGNVTIEGDTFANVTINLTGASTSSATTGSNGDFSFSGLANGTYTLIPSNSGYIFNPVSTVVTVNGANVSYIDFDATTYTGSTYDISGTVGGNVQSGVELTLSSLYQSGTVVTNSDGTYAFKNLAKGYTYTVIPSLSGYTFDPEYLDITISSKGAANIDFTSSL